MTTKLLRIASVAAILAAGGAMLASAQDAATPPSDAAPNASAGAPEADAPEGGRDMRMAHARDGERGDRDGRGHGSRKMHHGMGMGGHPGGPRGGAMLGAFGPAGLTDLFEAADGNADGALSQDEINEYLQSRLAEADGDSDGELSLEEFEPLFYEQLRPRMVDAFQRLDEDGSGRVTSEELDDRFGRLVERMDRDGDDALSIQDRGRGRR